MVRTKQVSKGSRASTRTRSSASRHSTRSSTRSSASSTINSTFDSEGFAVPAPVEPTLESLKKDLQEQFDGHLQEFEMRCKDQINKVKQAFLRHKVKCSAILKRPVRELLANYQPPPSTNKNPLPSQKSQALSSSVMQDRTNMQFAPKIPKLKVTSHTDKVAIKTEDKGGFKQPGSVPIKTRNSLRIQQQQTASANKYVTPVNARPVPSMVPVTPKVATDTPLSIIRRPRAGEFAMSIKGSPLMVSAIPREEIPSVCVPLPDGNVLSILPNTGITADQLPNLNADLKAQLEILQSNLRAITDNM